MKKLNSFILILFFGLILIGCQNHTHNYKAEVINPTCTTKGYITYTCNCGDSYQDNEIEALGHNYGEWEIVKEATEEEKGLKERKCSRCNDKQKEDIAIKEHTHKYAEEVISPTCVDKGYTLHTCSCGYSYKDNELEAKGHTEVILPKGDATCTTSGLTEGKKCSVCEEVLVKQEEIKVLGHNYSEWKVLKEATEETTGLKEKECSRCNDKQTEIIPELSHTHKYTDSIINPTCVDKGYILHTCKCGESYKDNYVDALGHTEVILPGYDATCTNTGLTEGKKCSVCEEVLVKQTEIKAKGHTEVILPKVDATCTTSGLTEGKKCSVCEEVLVKQEEIKAKGHTEVILPKVDATCTTTGLTEGKKCSICDEVLVAQEIISTVHNVVDGKCINCGKIIYTKSLVYELNKSKDGYIIIGCTNKDENEIIIPDTYNNYPVVEIAEGAFDELYKLKSLTISKQVKYFKGEIFTNCNSLEDVYYEGTIENWCNITFDNYYSTPMCYASLNLKNENNEWEEVKEIIIPNTIEKIGKYQFLGFRNITSIIISNSVTSIGDEAFNECRNIESIYIPASVASIGNGILIDCPKLTSIVVDKDNKIYDSRNNCNAIIETKSNNLIVGCCTTVIPSSVISIGEYAFMYCTSLTSIVLPNSITNIEDYAFTYCSSLTSIVLSNRVTSN